MKTKPNRKEHLKLHVLVLALLFSFAAFSACGGKGEPDILVLPDSTAPVTAASPGGGSYDKVQYVKLASSEAATIYYSLDGADPAEGAPNTASGSSPLFWIYIDSGTTVLKFYAVDTAGHQEPVKTETYVVTTPPTPYPVANAGPDQNVTTESLVTLYGSGTTANGVNPTFYWSFTSKPDGSTATLLSTATTKPTFTPDIAGLYVLSLVVNDGSVNSAPDTVVISAVAPVLRSSFDDGTLQGWTTNGSWGVTTLYTHSGGYSVTDSPGGNYLSSSNTSLVSPVIDLTGTSNPTLTFYHRHSVETNYDYGMVEISSNGGSTFGPYVQRFTGSLANITLVTIDLSAYKNSSSVVIRFRLTSDSIYNYDGWYIDDIIIKP